MREPLELQCKRSTFKQLFDQIDSLQFLCNIYSICAHNTVNTAIVNFFTVGLFNFAVKRWEKQAEIIGETVKN